MSDKFQQPSKSSDYVQSLARGLEILEVTAANEGEISIAEASEQTGLNRAIVRRLLLTLEAIGYLEKKGRNFKLAPKSMQLGYKYLASVGINELVSDELDKLAENLGEAVSLTVLDGHEIVYLARANINKVMTIALRVGARLPVWNTSMGRVLLAQQPDDEIAELLKNNPPTQQLTPFTITSWPELSKEIESVRKNSYSVVDQELEIGLRSVAVQVKRNEETVAALNVATANISESIDATVNRVLAQLDECSKKLTEILESAPKKGLRP